MPEKINVLLDQNVPSPVADWLSRLKPSWTVQHVNSVGLYGKSDDEIFDWAQKRGFIIVTFDEDFADRRLFSKKKHAGIIRLRIWPTTIEETQVALKRVIDEVPDAEFRGSLVIIDRNKIRIRVGK